LKPELWFQALDFGFSGKSGFKLGSKPTITTRQRDNHLFHCGSQEAGLV